MPSISELLANPSKGRSYGLYRFTNLAMAKDFAVNGHMLVVLGECETYFVAVGRIASQLVKVGFQWA